MSRGGGVGVPLREGKGRDAGGWCCGAKNRDTDLVFLVKHCFWRLFDRLVLITAEPHSTQHTQETKSNMTFQHYQSFRGRAAGWGRGARVFVCTAQTIFVCMRLCALCLTQCVVFFCLPPLLYASYTYAINHIFHIQTQYKRKPALPVRFF
jgi:hypothetical protein